MIKCFYLLKSIYHIHRLKQKNHMISTYKEKAFDKTIPIQKKKKKNLLVNQNSRLLPLFNQRLLSDMYT